MKAACGILRIKILIQSPLHTSSSENDNFQKLVAASAMGSSRFRENLIHCLAMALMVVIFVADLQLPLGVAAGVPYVAVILLAWWLPKRRHIIALAVIASALTVGGYLHSPHGSLHWVVVANRGLALFAIWATAILLAIAKTASKSLKETEDRLRRSVLDAPNPIMIHAEDGEVLMISNRWTELSGYSHSDIPTIFDWTEKAYGIDKDKMRELIGSLYELKGPIEDDVFVTTASGEQLIWNFRTAPLGRLNDGRRFVISMAVDVTERKQAEDEIKDSLAEKEILLSEIHHRVKNNLQVISSMLWLQANAENNTHTVEVLRDSYRRVMLMAQIHESLHLQDDISDINARDYLNALVDGV